MAAMAANWANSIFAYLQGRERNNNKAAIEVNLVGIVVPRPAQISPNVLVPLLQRDNRFVVFALAGDSSVGIYVGLSADWAPPGAVMIYNHKQNTIPFVADLFVGHLDTLAEERLVHGEKENCFKALLNSWRNPLNLRGAVESVKAELIGRGVITKYKGRFIISPPGRPERLAARKIAINATEGSDQDIMSDLPGVIVSQYVFHQDVNGVTIVIQNGNRITFEGYVQNDNAWNIDLTSLKPYHTHRKFRFYIATGGAGNDAVLTRIAFPVRILPGNRIRIAARFTANVNIATVNTILKFGFASEGANVVIGRPVTIHVGNAAVQTLLAPTLPYKRRARAQEAELPYKVVDGERPPGADSSNDKYKGPPQYTVPSTWRETCRLGEAAEQLQTQRQSLCATNLADLYHHLLWTEELQMDKDIKGYSVDNKTMQHHAAYLVLDVPGLAEKRPSVLKGDSVIVHRPGQVQIKYKGYVHEVQRDAVKLKFHRDFHRAYINGEKVNIEFTYNRMSLRICHQGVDRLTPELVTHLLPSVAPPAYPLALPATTIYPVNRNLNEQQLLAVKRIVQRSNSGRDCPYIIYGPPGTGKTSTMVEAIKQVGKLRTSEKILICAPSNTAADLLLRRLADTLPVHELFRFNSYQRDPRTVDAVARTRSVYDDAVQAFVFPGTEVFKKYKYVVATCCMAGKLHNYGIEQGHFSTVFVDEAGHGWEPEVIAAFSAMLDLSTTSTTAGQLVLAGDPQQLGPIVRSDAVDDAHGGLSVSLLQRLIDTHPAYTYDPQLYQDSAGYDTHVLTKLIQCYRCHPDILKLPNEMFYNSALVAAADRLVTHNLCNWGGLPRQNFPLVFHGIEGENIQESNSPSWFNIAEVEQVLHYVKELVDVQGVPAAEIAVIAPYHKQVTKINQLLHYVPVCGHRYDNVMVGTCEKMQGQERRVIIISAVRSSPDFLVEDRYFNLGFVSNPKRFNVAVTRAKALLIVIGNPHVLSRDPCWGGLLRYCVERGGYTGCALVPDGGVGPDGGAGAEGAESDSDADGGGEGDGGSSGGDSDGEGPYAPGGLPPPPPRADDMQGLVVDVARMGFTGQQQLQARVQVAQGAQCAVAPAAEGGAVPGDGSTSRWLRRLTGPTRNYNLMAQK